jgi:hypothetical protein
MRRYTPLTMGNEIIGRDGSPRNSGRDGGRPAPCRKNLGENGRRQTCHADVRVIVQCVNYARTLLACPMSVWSKVLTHCGRRVAKPSRAHFRHWHRSGTRCLFCLMPSTAQGIECWPPAQKPTAQSSIEVRGQFKASAKGIVKTVLPSSFFTMIIFRSGSSKSPAALSSRMTRWA